MPSHTSAFTGGVMAFISAICINLSVLSQLSNLTDQARKRDSIIYMENDYRDKENIFAVCKFSMTAMLISISLMNSPDIYTMDMSVEPINKFRMFLLLQSGHANIQYS